MGGYTYVPELWRKKQSDVMRFMQRVRCWEYRQLPSVVRVTHATRPDKVFVKRKNGFVRPSVTLRCGTRSEVGERQWRSGGRSGGVVRVKTKQKRAFLVGLT